MTEPVARAVSPRRTVRVAVALVAGQAALCVVIGWVTFGPSEAKPDAAGVHPLTEPILFPTPPSLPLQAAPAPPGASASPASRSASPRASKSAKPPTPRATSQPAAEKPRPVIAPGDLPPPSPPPNPDLVATPSPAPSQEVQSPVVLGTPCTPEGAEGLTLDEVDLTCVRDADGDLVWQIN